MPPPPPRFSTLVAQGWRLFTARSGALIALFIFAAIAVMSTKIAGDLASSAAGRPVALVILLESIVPVFAYGVFFAFAIVAAAVVLSDHVEGRNTGARDALRAVTPMARNILTAGLFSGMAAVVFLTLLPPVILFFPIFFGPPIVAQIIALDRLNLAPATTKARALLAGDGARVFGVLMPPALLTGSLLFFGPYVVAEATRPLGVAVQQIGAVSARVGLEGFLLACFATIIFAVYSDLVARKDQPAPAREREMGSGESKKKPA